MALKKHRLIKWHHVESGRGFSWNIGNNYIATRAPVPDAKPEDEVQWIYDRIPLDFKNAHSLIAQEVVADNAIEAYLIDNR